MSITKRRDDRQWYSRVGANAPYMRKMEVNMLYTRRIYDASMLHTGSSDARPA
jgi:hypothetical protein